jgi:hypothetical protein
LKYKQDGVSDKNRMTDNVQKHNICRGRKKLKQTLNIPIQDLMLHKKAEEIDLKLNTENMPSNVWLDQLRKHARLSYCLELENFLYLKDK